MYSSGRSQLARWRRLLVGVMTTDFGLEGLFQFVGGAFEFRKPTTEGFGNIGKTFWSEHDQGDGHDHEEFRKTYTKHI